MKHGIKQVPVVIKDVPEEELETQNLITAYLHGRASAWDLIDWLRRTSAIHGGNLDTLSKLTGVSKSWLAKLQKLAEADPEILAALETEKISIGAASELLRIPDKDARIRALGIVCREGFTVDETARFVDAVLEELKKKPEERTPVEELKPKGIVCAACGGEFPPEEIETYNICKGCWGLIVSAVAEARKAQPTPQG